MRFFVVLDSIFDPNLALFLILPVHLFYVFSSIEFGVGSLLCSFQIRFGFVALSGLVFV